ncbi:hypothetical protein CXB51_008899 [Gossypium anomalum]|uniref:GDSL esterase/lipase At5g33370-like n=1 Tax=Gossypium anomalum TaxID=47600 RepID=A0A8J5ZA02_9ROSI|nr:hypothetical protein CXB51_008899 [Gossypium anomalum]
MAKTCFHGVFVSIAVTSLLLLQAEAPSPPPPAVYIFGDSTLDVGTNNFIPECAARADFYFNGIDFPYSKPTGRFSNGLNTADQIVRLLGLKKSPPPFLYLVNDPSNFQKNILQGANFASGGSGVLRDTGKAKRVIPLEEQIQQFSTIRSNITNMTGSEEATDKILSKAFILISIGSNDMFEYLLNLSKPMSLAEFNATLISTYEYHIKTLYELGARTFGILTVPPIGCTPFARAVFTGNNSCFELAQAMAVQFYFDVASSLEQFSSTVQEMKYSVGNTFLMTGVLTGDMLAFGLKNIAAACCGNGTYGCNQTASFCSNRDEYLFWDQFHPTQRASELVALTLFGAAEPIMVPMNFSQLLGVNI